MRYLQPPTDENSQPYRAGDVFDTCVSMVRDVVLRNRLHAVRGEVVAESDDYDTRAAMAHLFEKATHDHVGGVSAAEMISVYNLRMVPRTSAGRQIYDRIMASPRHRRCPWCGIGTVNTLDHYLPKARFPVFAVTPNNLVPACRWCQTAKDDYFSATDAGQLLHPYFDNLDTELWLQAEVIVGVPAGFQYLASPPAYWPQSKKSRVSAHLNRLNLLQLFSANAGSRLSEIRGRLTLLHERGGPAAVRAHLQEELTSIEVEHLNSWTAAMYRATIADEWFLDGGFAAT